VTPRRILRTRLAVVAALLVTLFVGRLWGASGRWELKQLLQAAVLRGNLLEAHAALLGAQVSLCNANFGETNRRLEDARGFVERAGTRLGNTGPKDELLQRQLTGFSAGIDEARQLAARLSQQVDRASGVQGPVLPLKTSEKP
jgi:hypothetical protein